MKGKRCCGAMWQVGYCEGGWYTSMFVHEDEIGKRGGVGAGNQIRQDESASVQTNGSGQEESDLLSKCRKTGGRRARCGDQWPWVSDTGEVSVFVVDIFVRFRSFIKLVVLAKGFVVSYRWVEGFAGCKGGLELCTLLCGLCFAKGEGAAVKVVSPLASLSSLNRGD